MIKLKNVTKQYCSNNHKVTALEDINLSIPKGSICGILGKSGAGKSTLLRCVNLLEHPTEGEVFVNGVELNALNAKGLKKARQKISMIFQHFNLLQSRTAYDNIALPLELLGYHKTQIKEIIEPLVELVDLGERIHHYPNELSGGQKQRVAIARALTTEPHVLLCDEATSALDPESTKSVLKLLKSINKKLDLTILLITHELDVAKQLCDQVGVLDQGKLIEQGSVLDIFAEPKTQMTKNLTQKSLHMELPAHIQAKLKPDNVNANATLVRLTFINQTSDKPVMTTVSRQFNVDVSIVQASIENIQQSTIGFTVCFLDGEAENIKNALVFLDDANVKVEVLGYV